MHFAAVIRDLLTQHPLLIVFDILAVMTAAGCLLVVMREAVMFRGYRSLKRVAKAIRSTLQGSIFRDGTDLVISGFYRGVPAVVRFSFAENTPEMNVWMKVMSPMNLFVSHKSSRSAEGRVRIPTRDSWFDERFTIRTDNPNDAVAFLTDEKAFGELKKLCCSPGTSVGLTRDSLELSELTIPQPNTLKHLVGHMDSLGEVAVRVGAISGLRKSRGTVYVPDRYVLARVALAVLVIVGGFEVYSAAHRYAQEQAQAAAEAAAPSSENVPVVASEDEMLLPALSHWRVATPGDFDSETVAWMHEHGKNLSGREVGFFNGPGQPPGTAYIFAGENPAYEGAWRVSILSQGRAVLDASYKGVMGAVVVPKSNLANASWQQDPNDKTSTPPPDGDGLMIIRHLGDANSGTVFYLSNGKLQTRTPVDYLGVVLR